MLFRPVLMVLGFILGGAILIVAGTALNPMFASAMENAQFDSWTGLISILGFLSIYISLCLTLIHTSFNLVHVVPDQVLSWVGGNIGSKLGQDTEDRSKQTFVGGMANMKQAASYSKPSNSKKPTSTSTPGTEPPTIGRPGKEY